MNMFWSLLVTVMVAQTTNGMIAASLVNEYCPLWNTVCQYGATANYFTDLASCQTFMGMVDESSLLCRLNHLGLARTNRMTHCPHAAMMAPAPCAVTNATATTGANFCSAYALNCTVTAGVSFQTTATCEATFNGWSNLGKISAYMSVIKSTSSMQAAQKNGQCQSASMANQVESYCAQFNSVCGYGTTANYFPNATDCMVALSGVDVSGLLCRYFHLTLGASTSLSVHCPHAGTLTAPCPLVGATGFTYCNTNAPSGGFENGYCSYGGIGQFADQQACTTAYTAASDSTKLCMANHLSRATQSNAFAHCQHASGKAPCGSGAAVMAKPCSGSMTYSFQFQGMWANATHPLNYPANAHWSPIVVAAHSSAYTMWRTGWAASMGVKQVSMSGMTTNISSELNAAQMGGSVLNFVVGSGPIGTGTGSATVDITVNASFSYISMISMIAPSPDWFAGVDSVNMCDLTTGLWKKNVIMYPLRPQDSGAVAPPPVGTISEIMCGTNFCSGSGPVPSIATARINTKMMAPASSCTGSTSRMVVVTTNWVANSCPPLVIPSNPHFSPLVCAVHSSSYTMFASGSLASPGVKQVSETGNPMTLTQELAAAKTAGSVLAYSVGSPIMAGVGNASAMVMVNQQYPLVSCISMIAPSPDWFLGVSSYDVCGTGNMWKTMGMMNLLGYDAGTDSGLNFTAANTATMPPKAVGLMMEPTTAGCGPNGLGNFKLAPMPMNMTTPMPMPTTTSDGWRPMGTNALVAVLVAVVWAVVSA